MNFTNDDDFFETSSYTIRIDDDTNESIFNFLDAVLTIVNNIDTHSLMESVNEYLFENESLDMAYNLNRNNDINVQFDTLKYSDINLTNKNIDCSICITEFIPDDDTVKLKCNHLFHQKCITEWCKYKQDCPICREKLFVEE
jgi:hypothetical protein